MSIPQTAGSFRAAGYERPRGGPRIADPSTPEGAEQLRQAQAGTNQPYVQNIGHLSFSQEKADE